MKDQCGYQLYCVPAVPVEFIKCNDSVLYRYGDPLQMMIGCQNISKPLCDLSSVMMDVRNKYYGRIMADGLCLGEFEQFVPIEKSKAIKMKKELDCIFTVEFCCLS